MVPARQIRVNSIARADHFGALFDGDDLLAQRLGFCYAAVVHGYVPVALKLPQARDDSHQPNIQR